ncbi:MAG TPA: TraX family protein [Rickettsiales bacterium]|nr:TraX family protein [Rickettsiales bacterium]
MRFFKKATAYGNALNSYDALKLIALATMVIDHVGAYLYPDVDFLRVIGRMAFPLFLFLVGYSGNWAVRADLLWSAAAVAVCAVATHHPVFPLNILITIAVVRFVMPKLVKRELTPSYLSAIFIVSVVWYPLFLWLDYSTLAVLFAFCGYLRVTGRKAVRQQCLLPCRCCFISCCNIIRSIADSILWSWE